MERKMPTLVGLILVVIVVGAVIALFEYFTRTFSSAAGSQEPKNVTFTNVSDTTFTVTWLTDNPATGVVSVATGQKSFVAYDERDGAGPPAGGLGIYTGHSVPVVGLQPDTDYSVKVISNGKTYTSSGSPYRVRTGPLITTPAGGLEPAYGTATTANNSPASGALVYLTVEGGQTLSSLVGASGTWLVPLNLIRTNALSQYLPVKERLSESIRIVYRGEEASATTDTLNDSPVPTMEIGKTYDFRRQQAKTDSQAIAQSAEPQVLGEQTTFVSLAQPAEGAALPTNLPLFAGTGVPGRQIGLVIGITNPLSGTTTVARDGTWQFTPSRALGQGRQSVTVTSVDQQGKPVAITHTFTILKSGTQVLGEATPSATLAPTLTPTLSASPSPTSTLAGQPVPTSGTWLPTLLLILFGLAFLGSGVVMVVR